MIDDVLDPVVTRPTRRKRTALAIWAGCLVASAAVIVGGLGPLLVR
jgi:hypothetical protein